MGCPNLIYKPKLSIYSSQRIKEKFGLDRKKYRFAFNGKEVDNDIAGEGNAYDYGARILDTRLGRWMSIDPKFYEYSDISPYVFAGNSPILALDMDGEKIVIYGERYGFLGLKRHKYEYTPGSAAPEGTSQFVKDAFESLNYTRKGDDLGVIKTLVDSKKRTKIIETKKLNNTRYRRWDRTVLWNPKAALVIYDNEGKEPTSQRQTPAMGLYHELTHDYIRQKYSFLQKLKLATTTVDKHWSNAEEKEVIQKYESIVAKKIGEIIRNTHVGTDVKVSGPLSTK